MKKSVKKGVSLGMSALLALLIVVGILGNLSPVHASDSLFTNVTGSMDFSKLMQQQLSSSVMTSSQTKSYERRTVLVSLSGDSLSAYADGQSVSDFAASDAGQKKTAEMYAQQDALLAGIREAGIDCTLEYRYVAVDNAIAIEVNTRYVSQIRKMAGVDSVVIARSYTVPKTAEGSGSGSAVHNATSVYGTGVYDSSGALKDGLDGSGMLVAIIDTGLDYSHTAFQNMPKDQSAVALTEAKVAEILATKDLRAEERQLLTSGTLSASDVYVNAKVPFAYDYADNDADVYPSYSNHGTHVAGIVAGYDQNGYTDKDGNHVDEAFIGVAPEAQLVICKVFTDNLEDPDLGGADTEDILAALEDCMLLGVDVINMSLGTTCGFTTSDDGDDEGDYMNRVYTEIGKEGINLLCAASNDYSSGYGGVFGTNLSSNPDSGTVGSPATYASALSVASISGKQSGYLLGNGTTAIFFENSNDENSNPFDFVKQMLTDGKTTADFEYVVIPGVGLASDYTLSVQELVKGRIALVKRGDSTFQEKVEIARSFGAVGIIVYNNVSGTVRMSLGEVKDPIPAISIDMDAGEGLVKAATGYSAEELAAGAINRVGKLTVSTEFQAGPFMSEFSSWGATSDLKLKPEVTAHGGEITSAVPGGYTEMSGTSMACPNMAGVVALLRSYVKQTWPELNAVEVTRRVNQLLMSTATTVYDQDALPYSPRKQGAGLGSLDNSRTTSAYLWADNADNDYRPKIELGDDKDKTGVYTMSFCLTNFGTEALTFKTQALFMTETLSIDGLTVAEQAHMLSDVAPVWKVNGKTLADGETFTVAANTDAVLELTLTLSDAEKQYIDTSFANGMYVEGFAKLLSSTSGQCDLVLPFMGFYGDWADAPMLDYDAYELAKQKQDSSIPDDEKPQASVWATQPYITYYNDEYVVPMGSYLYTQDENADQIYADEEHNAISCYNQYYGEDNYNNYMTTYRFKGLYAGLLRSARYVNYKLVNDDTGEVLDEEIAYRVAKAYADGGSSHPALIELEMDPLELGMTSGEHYTMTFEFYLDYKDQTTNEYNTKETYSYSFYVDYEAPVLQDVRVRYYDYKDGNKTRQRIYLDLDVFDNHYAQSVMLTYLEDNELKLATDYVTPVYNANKNGTTTVSIEITDIYEKYKDSLYVQVDDYALNHSVYWLNLSKCNQTLAPDYFELAEGEESVTLGVYETHTVALNYDGDGNLSNFAWSSNNRSVADVKNGEIVGLAPGTATITVTGSGGTRESVSVTVTDEERTLQTPSISFGPIINGDGNLKKAQGTIELYPGTTFTLDVLTDPWYYPLDRLTLQWESTNPAVATVDQNGCVNTLAKGTAVIKAIIVVDGSPTLYTSTVTLSVQDVFEVSGYSLIKYHGADSVVRIPTDRNIMMIGEDAFKDNDTVTEIIIPKSVTSIGTSAFENCSALKRVYFVDEAEQAIADADVSVIYKRAFYGCTALELVDFSNVKVVTLGNECFYGCTNLSEIRKLTKVGTVSDYTFANCTSLTSLDLTGMQVCGTGAFSGCTALTDIQTGSVTKLGDYAFAGCTAIRNLTLYASRIGAYAFEGCSNLRNVQICPVERAIIGDHAFDGCASLRWLTFDPNSTVLSIGDSAFANTALQSFTMPNGLTALGNEILAGSAVDTITVGDGFDLDMIQLMGIPFSYLKVNLEEGCTKYCIENGVLYTADKTKLLAVLAGTTQVEIPNSVLTIGDYAFAGSRVSTLTIPASVQTLGQSVFADSALAQITFASGCKMTQIPADTFSGSKLVSIEIPASVTAIGAYAFADSNLSSITFAGSKVGEIGDGAFSSCTYLQKVALPDGVSVMGESVFENCTNLTEAKMPSVTSIGAYTFIGCTNLHTVAFGSGAQAIGEHAFYRCTALKNVTLGSAMTEIPEGAFVGCTALETVDLKNTVAVGTEAFAECTALCEVIGLDRLEIIGDTAFYNCSALRALHLTAAREIGEGAFAIENGGYAYTEVTIPAAVKIGSMAFYGGREQAIEIPATLQTLQYGAFANSPRLATVTVDANNQTFFTKDGVLFRALSENTYELCCFPGGLQIEGDTYTVPDGTVRIDAYAFNGIGKQAPKKVVLPWSLRVIGVSAFYESGITNYTFESINAPTLCTVYRDDVVSLMEEAASNTTADTVAVNGLFYANFDSLMVYYIDMIGQKSDLVMQYPENGVGYDNYIYTTYFGTRESLGVLMDETTRSAIDAIEALEDISVVRAWQSLEVNDENRAIVEAFAERVKEARRLYGNVAEEQLSFISETLSAKLTEIETEMRSLKSKFSIPLVVSDIRVSDGYRKQYKEGDIFDIASAGLVLTVVYDDYSTEPADMSRLSLVEPTGALTRYDVEVLLSYRYGDGADEVKTFAIRIDVAPDDSQSGTDTGENNQPGISEDTNLLPIILISAGVLLAAAVAVGVVLLLRKRKKEAQAEGAEKPAHPLSTASIIRIAVICAVAVAVIVLVVLLAVNCNGQENDPLADIQASVYYDANGGIFDNNQTEKTIGYLAGTLPLNIGVQNLTNGSVGIKRDGYRFCGWYLAQTDASGKALTDTDGKTVLLGDAFDFTKRLEDGQEISLYAKWEKDKSLSVILAGTDLTKTDGTTVATGSVIKELSFVNGSVSEYGDLAGAIGVSDREYTFIAYYTDAACTELVKWPISTSEEEIAPVYAKFVSGQWEKVSTPEEAIKMFENAMGPDKYMVIADIDLGGKQVTTSSRSSFMATIDGGGHTISNFTLTLDNVDVKGVSMFGTLSKSASVTDLSLRDVDLQIALRNGVMTQIYFLFGNIEDGAVVSGLQVQGKMTLKYGTDALATNIQPNSHDAWVIGGENLSALTDGRITVDLECTVGDTESYRYPET